MTNYERSKKNMWNMNVWDKWLKRKKQKGGIDIGVMPPQNNYVSPTQRLQK